jgi:F-type H+-transporting ATPase subunit b
MSLLLDTDFIVLASFLTFVAILWYYGVHKYLGGQLDQRAERIRTELDEARRLREEAQKTFAEFERKRAEADAEVAEIVEHAKSEAEAAAARAKDDLQVQIDRRLKAADEQIAMAEANAVKDVRDRAAQIAVAAAAEVMKARMTDEAAGELVDSSIETVGQRLN